MTKHFRTGLTSYGDAGFSPFRSRPPATPTASVDRHIATSSQHAAAGRCCIRIGAEPGSRKTTIAAPLSLEVRVGTEHQACGQRLAI